MKILTFSSLYPNNVDPSLGIFVERRLNELTKISNIVPTVIAPVPWFPFRARIFGSYAAMAAISREDVRFGLPVFHPRFPLVPKVGMTVTPWFMAMSVLRTVRALMRTQGPWSLIDAHYFYPDGVAAAMLAKKLSLPYVITARGSDINLIAQYATPRRMILNAAAGAHAVIAVSGALAERMIQLGIPAQKIHVLRNGVDAEFFTPGDMEGARIAVQLSGKIIVSVGDLKSSKGHDIAIRFMVKQPDASLVVIGRGPDEQSLKHLAHQLGVDQRVRFTGTLHADELRTYYRAADALVLMSQREGMPNVLLESLACGTPVLATGVGGVPEIMTSRVAGEIVLERSIDGLQKAWQSLVSRGIDRVRIREHAEQFSWGDTSRGLLAIMSDCVRGS